MELDQNTDFQVVDVDADKQDKYATPVDAGKAQSTALTNLTPPANRVTKKLVLHEVRKQSVQFVRRLSVIERHRMLIHPNSFQDSMAESIKKDKTSILSSSDLNSTSKNSSLCENFHVKESLVKTSVNMLMGNAWNPNMVIRDKTGPCPFNRSAVKQPFDAQLPQKGASMFQATGPSATRLFN